MFGLLAVDVCTPNTQFVNVNSRYGTSFREVWSVCEDDDGFVWSSSKGGIMRFTDGGYRIYNLPYRNTDISWVKLACKSQLYAYTNNGEVFRYNDVSDSFEQVLDLRKRLNNKHVGVYALSVDGTGSVWIASSFGIYRYKGLLTRVREGNGCKIMTFCKDNLLLLGGDEGVETLRTQDLKFSDLFKSNLKISALRYDEETNRLWIGTHAQGLFYFDLKANKLNEVGIGNFSSHPITSIEKNAEKSLLVGIDGNGVWEISEKGDKVLGVYKEDANEPSSLRGNGVYDIFRDRNNRVWVATFSGGLSYFDREAYLMTQITHQPNKINSLGDNNINRVLEDEAGDLWVATSNGVSRRRKGADAWNRYCHGEEGGSSVIMALCEDNDGNIWVGGYSSGVRVLNKQTGNEVPHIVSDKKNAGVMEKFVLDIYKDTDGDIWVGGTEKGIICYLSDEKKIRTYRLSTVSYFTELEPGKLLIANFNNLVLLDKKSGGTTNLLSDYIVQDIFVQGGIVWIATSGHGLIRYDPLTKEKRQITAKDGLPSDYVGNIAYANHNLILATETSLCRLNLENNIIYNFPPSFSRLNTFYFIRSRAKLRNGDILLGSNNGILMFGSDIVNYNYEPHGKIFIQDIALSGQSIRKIPSMIGDLPVNKHNFLSLNYEQNNLALELLPIEFNAAGNKFSWMLEGIDKEWSKPSELNKVTYTNLPSGDYQLGIKMYDASLSKVVDERSLVIHITPPFWNTWWFYLIAAVVASAVVAYAVKSYANRIKQKYARDKIRFFTHIAHDIRTSLTLIKNPIDEVEKDEGLSQKSHYYLRLAREHSKKLALVATQLLDFQKTDAGKEHLSLTTTDVVQLVRRKVGLFGALAEEKKLTLNFASNQNSFVTAIDESKMEKVIENLLSNAIKYSFDGGQVHINLCCESRKWTLSVQDHGIGIAEDETKKLFREFYRAENAVSARIIGSGIGLLQTRDYVAMHGGRISLQSKENSGSTFSIEVPYSVVEGTNPVSADVETGTKPGFGVERIFAPEPKTDILIVEDNGELREFLRVSLSDTYHVQTAGNGAEAWRLIQKKAPGLVISDVMMPEMDGFELCRLIKSTLETSHIPVILLTALSAQAQELEGLGLGADDYVTKPFDMAVLVQRIVTILKNREAIREKTLKLVKPIEEDVSLFANELNDQFVKKALRMVEKNLSNSEFNREMFASMMNVSTSLLYNKIKSLTGQSPIELITTIRMKHAAALLQSKKYTVTEVSEICGFSSANYFSSAFKKYFGKPPADLLG